MAALALGTTDLIDRRLALLTCHAEPRSGLRQKCILSVYHLPPSILSNQVVRLDAQAYPSSESPPARQTGIQP